MLTQHFADVEYTDDEMKAVNAYCRGKDRNDEWFYRRVNRYIRGQGSHHDAEAAAIGDRIDDALAREVTPQRIVAFRGLKNLDALGVDHSNVVHLTGRVVVLTGYQSTTIDPAVAIEDFAGPPGQGAVLRIEVPVGTEAIWVPTFNPVGKFSDQRELLLDTGHAVTVRSVSQETGTLWVTCEILT